MENLVKDNKTHPLLPGAVLGGAVAAIGRWRRKATQRDQPAPREAVSKARRMIGLILRAASWGLMIPSFVMLALYVAEALGWSMAGINLRKAGEHATHFPVVFVAGLLLMHEGGWVRGHEPMEK